MKAAVCVYILYDSLFAVSFHIRESQHPLDRTGRQKTKSAYSSRISSHAAIIRFSVMISSSKTLFRKSVTHVTVWWPKGKGILRCGSRATGDISLSSREHEINWCDLNQWCRTTILDCAVLPFVIVLSETFPFFLICFVILSFLYLSLLFRYILSSLHPFFMFHGYVLKFPKVLLYYSIYRKLSIANLTGICTKSEAVTINIFIVKALFATLLHVVTPQDH